MDINLPLFETDRPPMHTIDKYVGKKPVNIWSKYIETYTKKNEIVLDMFGGSDFTVNKKEKNVQGDVVNLMIKLGFDFVGTTILLQETKPLYPFGYPYSYVINHHHQNIINFRKNC